MTKKEQNASPITPASKVGKLVKTNGTSEEKKIPRFTRIELISDTCDDGNIVSGLVVDGVPALYSKPVFTRLGMTRQHARGVIKKLTENVHYYAFSREELEFIPNVNKLFTFRSDTSKVYFLTEEGYYRAIQEVGTGSMNDPDIAASIESLKNDMASVFARYKRGEVLLLKGDTPKRKKMFIPGAGILRDRLRQADSYIKHTGCSKKEALLTCLKIADEDHKRLGGSGFEALIAKTELMPNDNQRLLPAQPGLYISVTKIGKILGVSGQAVNKYLDKLGYQESAGSDHTPTEVGVPYSRWEEVTITKSDGSQTVKLHLTWSIEIVDKLRIHIEAEQATLPECFS